MTQETIAAAHRATPTCGATAAAAIYCHSLACRTRARIGAGPQRSRGTRAEIRVALADLYARAMTMPSPEAKLGTLEGGIESILICLCGMTGAEVQAIAGGVR